MTHKTQKVDFNFTREVNVAFRRFPQLSPNTIFINGEEGVEAFHANSSKAAKHPSLNFLLDEAEDALARALGSGILKERGLFSVLINNAQDGPHVSPYLALDHELGHLLVPGALKKEPVFQENAADAFAAISHLQRSGNRAALAAFSGYRAYTATYFGTTNYLTAPLLNQILMDSHRRNFRSLSPEETIKAAHDYAQKHTPSPKQIEKVTALSHEARRQSGNSRQKFIEIMATTALSSSDRFIFQVGFALFQPFFAPEGVTHGIEHIRFSPNVREEFHKKFTARARRHGLDDLANYLEENKKDMLSPRKTAAKKQKKLSRKPPRL